jgi:hypothetical protein
VLTIPAPTLDFEPQAAGVAALELPLTVALGPVTQDGATLAPPDLATSGMVSYRTLTPGSQPEVWAPDLKQWLPEAGDAAVAQPLAFLPEEPQPWQGLVVAAGAVDASGAPVYASSGASGFPTYSFAALFVTHGEEAGLSGNSPPVSFRSVSDRNLMVLGPGDGEKPEQATQARLQLRSTSLATIGGLVIDRDSPGAEVTLSNSAGASVVLRPDGTIELRPAAGRNVVVTGDMETERITYLPATGGGPKKNLM